MSLSGDRDRGDVEEEKAESRETTGEIGSRRTIRSLLHRSAVRGDSHQAESPEEGGPGVLTTED